VRHEQADRVQLQMPKLGVSGRIRCRPSDGRDSSLAEVCIECTTPLGNTQEYLDLAVSARDRGERVLRTYRRVVPLRSFGHDCG
jgi:hypothetical protein